MICTNRNRRLFRTYEYAQPKTASAWHSHSTPLNIEGIALKKYLTADQEALLLEGLIQYSRKAYSELYDYYGSTLLGFINRMVNDQVQAEDLLQETFIKVWQQIHRYDPAKGRLFTWLLKIARNTTLDYLRSPDYTNSVEFQWKMGETILTNENLVGLRETVLSALSPDHQAVIELIYFQGYTQQQAADELALPLGTVKTRVRMALIELKNRFSSER
ncbi:RNA polymerase sigma factor [Larkinella terrae]|uniref:RNA polymerase sigma factor n=1 Tax=Larkinella terrae TaxID=2025311 RepID=A0A7K0EU75_9BACT|nr:RNA polymerase sigma factor [Larkinella terrae]MRS65367.1 sigma-70 family RNA polymerase sigma factor [Larkinella terrae]